MKMYRIQKKYKWLSFILTYYPVKNFPYPSSDYLYHFQNSILFHEVPFQAMPEPSRSHEALPYQDHER